MKVLEDAVRAGGKNKERDGLRQVWKMRAQASCEPVRSRCCQRGANPTLCYGKFTLSLAAKVTPIPK